MKAHNTNKIAALIIKYRKTTLSDKEQEELDAWRSLTEENERLFKSLTDDSYLTELKIDVRGDRKKIRQFYKADTGRSLPMKRSKVISIAASIIILLTAGTIFLSLPSINNKPVLSKSDPKTLRNKISTVKNVQQLANEATLTLSNGLTIQLDKMETGNPIYNEHGRSIVKVNDKKLQIVPDTYAAPDWEPGKVSKPILNTISVPRGREYELELADGSTVWLNAASTFSFPMAFNAPQRCVKLIGEAYFKVTTVLSAGRKVPFNVNARDMKIGVWGTEFTVNAYPDEPEIRTTLIEGAIDICQDSSTISVKPGQQAVLSNGQLTLSKANIEEETAWKNNQFFFQATPLKKILQQASRWYDVDFTYDCCELKLFNTTIPRNKPLSVFLKILESTEEVHFEINGKNIHVTSK